MKLFVFQILASLALLWLPSVVVGGEAGSTTLRWNFHVGQDLKLQIAQTNTLETLAKDRPLTLVMQTAMELAWHVDRVAVDGTAQIRQSFTRVVVKTRGPDGKTQAYDSLSATAPSPEMQELSESVRRLLGVQCQVMISARGEITEVKPASETASQLRDAPGAAGWLRLLTTAGINQLLRPAVGILPAKSVAAGDTWESNFDLGGPAGKLQVATTYTYRGTERLQDQVVARIEADTQVTASDDQVAGVKPPGASPQQYHGTLLFSVDQGQLIRSKLEQHASSEATYRGQSVPLKASNTVVLRIEQGAR